MMRKSYQDKILYIGTSPGVLTFSNDGSILDNFL